MLIGDRVERKWKISASTPRPNKQPYELLGLHLVGCIRIALMLGPHLGRTDYKSVGTSNYTNTPKF
jgi:hypothetical protein